MKEDPSNLTTTTQFSALMNRTVNIVFAGLLSIPALVIIGVLYVIRSLREKHPRAPFFYSGVRLGKNFKPFTMYKIRTLKVDSEFENQGVILPPGSARELPLGRFLRDSRLDELPQLWNVICGEMNLVGPAPYGRSSMSSFDRRFQTATLVFESNPD